MISRVSIKNFKSIGETGVDLELKPLTLLVGPNGGGKSSILEAICVASQQNRSGRPVDFPSWESVIHKPNGSAGSVEINFVSADRNFSPGIRQVFGTQNQIDYLLNSSVTLHAEVIGKVNNSVSELRSRAFLLSSVRGDVPYSTNTGATTEWVGVHGQDLLLLLALIFGQRRHKDIASGIAKWASRFGVGERNAGLRGGNRSGSDYVDSELKAVLDLALAGSGARQILTVITQLFWAPNGSLIMIEKPEISLHPKAQVDVLEMFGEAIKEHKQIVATTHSISLLQALGYAGLKGWLAAKDIAVYHVEKGLGGTTATLLPLAENGYIRDWVPSFTEVERDLLLERAKTLPRE